MLQNRTNSYQIRAKSHKFAHIHAKLVNYKYRGVRAPESQRPKAYKIVQIRTLRRKIVEIRAKIVQNLTNWCKFLQIHTKIANQSYKGCAPQKHGVQNFVRFYKFAHNGAKSCEFVPKSYKIAQICLNSCKFIQKLQIISSRGRAPRIPASKVVQSCSNSYVMLQNCANSCQNRAKSHKLAQTPANSIKNCKLELPGGARPRTPASKIVQVRT